MSSNLKRRHQTWYVRVGVNPKHWDIVGRREIVRSLKTRDRRVAERLKHAVIDQIRKEIDRQVKDSGVPVSDPRWLMNIARELRSQEAAGHMDHEEIGELMALMRDKHHTAAGISEDEVPATSRAATMLAVDASFMPITEAVKAYLDDIEKTVIVSTYKHKKKRLEEFTVWSGDIKVTDVSRKVASRYVTNVLSKSGLSPSTNKHTLSELHSFFEWLTTQGDYESLNPFSRQGKTLNGPLRGSSRTNYRAWTKAELKKLFKYLDAQKPNNIKAKAADVARISLYSGMRLNEICALKTGDVNLEDGYMIVSEGKRDNSVRQVPIHDDIKNLLKRLLKDSTDDFVIAGLRTGGDDSKRAHGLGNRFSEVKRTLFPDSGREHAFHGLRSTFITACEKAGIPETTTKLLVGHARQGLSYGLYSKGLELDGLLEAVAKVEVL